MPVALRGRTLLGQSGHTRYGRLPCRHCRLRSTGRTGRRRSLVRSLVPVFSPLLQTLQRFVDPDGQKLDYQVGNAQPALELLHALRIRIELEQNVSPFAKFVNAVSQPAL